MSPLLFVTLLVVGADAKADAPKLDGKWLIVYAEEGGRRNNAWEQKVATVGGKTLTFKDGDKERSLSLTYGKGQTLKATFGGKEAKEGTYSGVYIAGQDYLSLSLNPPEGGDKEKGTSSAAFILILRKQQK